MLISNIFIGLTAFVLMGIPILAVIVFIYGLMRTILKAPI